MRELQEIQQGLAGARSIWRGALPARENLTADLLAGLTVAVASLPYSMASAVMAGLNPVQGLYASMIGGPVGAITSSSVFMVIGPTAATALATGVALAGLPEEQKLGAAVTLTILIGIFQVVVGLARLGFLTRYISNAVMTGFLTGVAFLIILSQLGDLTRLSFEAANKALRLLEAAARYRELNVSSLVVGAVTIALVFIFERTRLKKLAMLLALASVSGAVNIFGWSEVALVGESNTIPRSLPQVFTFDLVHFPGILSSAVAIGIIGLMQGAGIGHAYPNPDGKYPDASRDFWAQGASNTVSGVFQGMPVSGSAWATAVNVSAGARTRWSKIFCGLFLIIAVLVVGGLIERIPVAALAGLLALIGVRSVNLGRIKCVWQTGFGAAMAMVTTFLATLALPIQYAVFLGVVVSFLVTVISEAEKVLLNEIVLREGELPEERPAPLELSSNKITILHPYGSLFFAGARSLEERLPRAERAHRAAVILLLREYTEIGSTFIGVLQRYATVIQKNGGRLMLAGVNRSVWRQLSRTGTLALIGEENVFPAGRRLFESALAALRSARAWLAEPPQEQ